jgi:hypothetical protein
MKNPLFFMLQPKASEKVGETYFSVKIYFY